MVMQKSNSDAGFWHNYAGSSHAFLQVPCMERRYWGLVYVIIMPVRGIVRAIIPGRARDHQVMMMMMMMMMAVDGRHWCGRRTLSNNTNN